MYNIKRTDLINMHEENVMFDLYLPMDNDIQTNGIFLDN
jgi:hypothetical protein